MSEEPRQSWLRWQLENRTWISALFFILFGFLLMGVYDSELSTPVKIVFFSAIFYFCVARPALR